MEYGSKVKVIYESNEFYGTLVESSDKKIILLKLESGYNIGLPKSKVKISTISKPNYVIKKSIEKKINSSLPNITIISTGGTIASEVDYKTGAVTPVTKTSKLLEKLPEIKNIANINTIEILSKFSEDLSVEDWTNISNAVYKELSKDNIRGVVVTHGTDTLHYSSAALSFALQNLGKPVVFVGGQRSSDRGSFDGGLNLICGLHVAKSDIAEVLTVMHGSSDDNFCLVNRGNKVKKMHTTRRDSFRPINTVPIAKVYKDGKIEIHSEYNLRHSNKPKLMQKFDEKVALIKYYPGMDLKLFDFLNKNNYKGIIIEGTGLGHIHSKFLNKISELIKSGIFIGMTSQANYGSVNPYVYASGRNLFNHGVTYLEDMLPETAYVKLSWVIANFDSSEIKQKMKENISREYSEASHPNDFLY